MMSVCCVGNSKLRWNRFPPVIMSLMIFVVCSFLMPHYSYSADIYFEWYSNTEPDLAGYRLYYGHSHRDYLSPPYEIEPAVAPSFSLKNVSGGQSYFFAITAVDSYGNEGELSEELVCHTIVPVSDPNGSIYPSSTVVVQHGSSQTFTITVDPGFFIKDLLVDGVSVGPSTSYTFADISGSHSIEPLFAPDPHMPVADAGPNQTVDERSQVLLDGSNSTDADNDIVTYSWTQIGGTLVDLTGANAAESTFAAPAVPSSGEALTFQLTVTDGSGLHASDTCIVNVSNVNVPPQANAGSDQTVNEWSTVTLDASNSTDPDDMISSYLWTQISGPMVELTDRHGIQPGFISPDVGPQGSSLSFRLLVTDSGGLQSDDTCIVNVSWINEPPVAEAGPDQTVNEGTLVRLNASGSTDQDDGIAGVHWYQTEGPPVVFNKPTSSKTSFMAPRVGESGASINLRLVVSDHEGLSASDNCVIHVRDVGKRDLTGRWLRGAYKGGISRQTLRVKNVGDQVENYFQVRCYLSDNPLTLGRLVRRFRVSKLGPGKFLDYNIVYKAPQLYGKHMIAVIDSTGSAAEENEANNRVVTKIR